MHHTCGFGLWIYWTTLYLVAHGPGKELWKNSWHTQGRQNHHQLDVSVQSIGEIYQLQGNENGYLKNI